VNWWHGGPSGRVVGDVLEPQPEAGTRSGDPDGWVYLARDPHLALMYARSSGGSLYECEVEPEQPIQQDPGSILPQWESVRVRRAIVVAVHNVERARQP
jgi:hypothetical protein